MQKALDEAVAAERFHGGRLALALQPYLEADPEIRGMLARLRERLTPSDEAGRRPADVPAARARRRRRDTRALAFIGSYHALIRWSFLGEFVKERGGATKMDTRWGDRLPAVDPRRATFDACSVIFRQILLDLVASLDNHDRMTELHLFLGNSIQPYEVPIDYLARITPEEPIHRPGNVAWMWDDPVVAAAIKLRSAVMDADVVGERESLLFSAALANKIQVKTYLTDRVQTGDHQTNREKRWETHPLSVHYALRRDCLGIERELIQQLCFFEGFSETPRRRLLELGVIEPRDLSRCPVTLAPFSYSRFCDEIGEPEHGESDFQVGHLRPLKLDPNHAETGHTAANIAWVSAEGNRIQGSLSLEDTRRMLREMARRYDERGWD